MAALSALAYAIGYSLILLTAIDAVRAAWQRRERSRNSILLFVVGLAAMPRLSTVGGIRLLPVLLLIQVVLLLRLVRHFRDVPAVVSRLTLAFLAAAVVMVVVWPVSRPAPITSTISAFVTATIAYAALALTVEARRTSGVTAKRLVLAAAGSWMFSAVTLVTAIGSMFVLVADAGGRINPLVTPVMLICYSLAFATPRWLRMRWQRMEQARYLSAANERDPEDRGARAAEDLCRGAAGAVGNSLVVVALGDAPGATSLRVHAATDSALVGTPFQEGRGLVGDAVTSLKAVTGPVRVCEPALAPRLAVFGTQVLVAPIAAAAPAWGAVLAVQRRGSLFPDDDLQMLAQLGRYAAIALDHAHLVAERRERERRAADRRLREVESRMGLMLDSIRDYAMFVVDHRGRVVDWHLGAELVFGHNAQQIADEDAAQLFDLSSEEFLRLLDEARRVGHAEREGPCRRRDGERFVGATTIRPLQSDVDDLDGFVAVTRDVTERLEMEDRLRQAQKMEAIGQLAGGIAHDFNNLLTAVMGYSDLLAVRLPPNDENRASIAEIRKAADRAAGLTRQLLAFARRQMLQPSTINLARLAGEVLPMLRRVIGEHIEVVGDISPDTASILGDRTQIEQIILNLAVNARDAMPRGGRLTVKTSNVWLDAAAAGRDASPGPYVLLEVSDTGMGMDAATRSRIFEPFFTTKEVGRGTGLGLATVYGIVQQMGGMVRVDSEPLLGATFRLYLPEARAKAPTVPSPGLAAAAARRGHETLLLVEDDAAVRSLLARALEAQGYRVLEAENQTTAVALARAHEDDLALVITDVLMPGGTGVELVRALEDLHPGWPVLYISGYAEGVLSPQGIQPKASHFLQKPFNPADLLARVAVILTPQP